jgi:hypothetical protein
MPQMPDWIVKLARRIVALGDGCWRITLICKGNKHSWIVESMGKLEHE